MKDSDGYNISCPVCHMDDIKFMTDLNSFFDKVKFEFHYYGCNQCGVLFIRK